MSQVHYVKDGLCLAAGFLSAMISAAFGGWTDSMTALIIMMAIDYATGLIVAGIFHRSRKTADGRLESKVGWKGLVKKGITLAIVLVACQLDKVLGTSIIRDTVVIAFIANEVISITENAGLMGIPMPRIVVNAIEVLKNEADARSLTKGKDKPDTGKKANDPFRDDDLNDPEG